MGLFEGALALRPPRDPKAIVGHDGSELEHFASVIPAHREAWVKAAPEQALRDVMFARWDTAARPSQRPPAGDWRTWLIMAGRGFGKTRTGAEWVADLLRAYSNIRIALVGGTRHETNAVMVEGESGLLALLGEEAVFEKTNRRIVWKEKGKGNQVLLYSAEKPEELRGPQHHFAWCDEIAKWPRAEEAWRNLAMGLRLGKRPRSLVTTTPRPVPIVRALVAMAGVETTSGTSAENRTNLSDTFLSDLTNQYGGTAFGRQELGGELIEEIEGALWSRALIERQRVTAARSAIVRTVVGVDPPAGAGASSDACGIVVVGLGEDGAAYVLADASVAGASPERWARAVADTAEAWKADRVVAEANNGGAMIESVLRAADAHLPVRLVHASVGKAARAEPVAALYEAGRAWHAGAFSELEDELCGLILGGGYEGPGRSPDRADACVWAMHALMLGKRRAGPGVRVL